MDSTKLEHFLAVVEHGHFRRAAESLGISQQAISKSIAQLEKSLAVKLLKRGQFGAVTTHYGDAFATRARLIMSEIRISVAEIDALRGSRHGHVRVGVGLGMAGRLMPMAIERFRTRHPRVQVTAVVESSAELFPMLLRGELDFCVSAPPSYFQLDPELAVEPLFSETDVVIGRKGHPLAASPRRDLAALRTYPWIMSAQLTDTWKRICREFTGAGLDPPEQLIRTDSVALARELVLLGDYLVLLARENVARELQHGLLSEIPLARIPDTRPAILTTRQRAVQQPAAMAFIRIVRRVCADIHGPPPRA